MNPGNSKKVKILMYIFLLLKSLILILLVIIPA